MQPPVDFSQAVAHAYASEVAELRQAQRQQEVAEEAPCTDSNLPGRGVVVAHVVGLDGQTGRTRHSVHHMEEGEEPEVEQEDEEWSSSEEHHQGGFGSGSEDESSSDDGAIDEAAGARQRALPGQLAPIGEEAEGSEQEAEELEGRERVGIAAHRSMAKARHAGERKGAGTGQPAQGVSPHHRQDDGAEGSLEDGDENEEGPGEGQAECACCYSYLWRTSLLCLLHVELLYGDLCTTLSPPAPLAQPADMPALRLLRVTPTTPAPSLSLAPHPRASGSSSRPSTCSGHSSVLG